MRNVLIVLVLLLCVFPIAHAEDGFFTRFQRFFGGHAENISNATRPITPVAACSRCDAVVCTYAAGGLFVCDGNLVECRAKYGNCSAPGCYNQPGGCLYNSVQYHVGEQFKSTDGCNVCTCTKGGVACTGRVCPTTRNCTVGGIVHAPGESWSDGCNSCSCGENGDVGCTARICPPDFCTYQGVTHKIGDTWKSDSCTSCSCDAQGIASCKNTCDCPEVLCSPAPVGCRYTGTDAKGCATCTDLKCDCPQIECPAPPAGCHYASTNDETGCRTCGRLECTKSCNYNGQVLNVGQTVKISACGSCTCTASGEVQCQVNPADCAAPPPGCHYTGSNDSCSCGKLECPTSCTYNGQRLTIGEVIRPSPCSSCTCTASGEVQCQVRAVDCAAPPPGCHYAPAPNSCSCGTIICSTVNSCSYNGTVYQQGQSFKSADGCNTCSCTDGGRVVCTLRACIRPADFCNTAADCVRQGSCCDCGTGTWVNKESYVNPRCDGACGCMSRDAVADCIDNRCVGRAVGDI